MSFMHTCSKLCKIYWILFIILNFASRMAEGIRKFYKDKTIFVTGGSGFMGKVLLEKLLYSCPDLKEIMILMRPKRGKTGAERVKEFAQIPVSCSRRLATNLQRNFLFSFIALQGLPPDLQREAGDVQQNCSRVWRHNEQETRPE